MCSLISDFDGEFSCSNEPHAIAYDDFTRREVRSLVFHVLYAVEAFDYQISLESIIDNFNRGFNLDIPAQGEIYQVTSVIIEHRDSLDEYYKPFLTHWPFDRLSVCTKLILRFAVWEIMYTQTNERIIINEAVELAKCFAEEDAYRFINGVLDRVAKSVRTQNSVPSNDSSTVKN